MQQIDLIKVSLGQFKFGLRMQNSRGFFFSQVPVLNFLRQNRFGRLMDFQKSGSKIEFFGSQSSFSEMPPQCPQECDPNYIIDEGSSILTTLQGAIPPNQKYMDIDHVDYLVNRARILTKDTIPSYQQSPPIENSGNMDEEIIITRRKIEQFLYDYDSLNKQELPYKQFYNLYGRQTNTFFSMGKHPLMINVDLEPQCVQILQPIQSPIYRSTPSQISHTDPIKTKELADLREELHRMKTQNHNLKRQHAETLKSYQISQESRVANLITLFGSQNEKGQIAILQKELMQTQAALCSSLKENQQAAENQDKLAEDLRAVSNQKELLQQRISSQRPQNQVQNISPFSSSFKTEGNPSQLKAQNIYLQKQLKDERLKFDEYFREVTQKNSHQNIWLKKEVEEKDHQLLQSKKIIDQLKVECLQLKTVQKSTRKELQYLSVERFEMKQQVQMAASRVSNFELEVPKINKCTVLAYEGDGIQGYPYYETLTREFKLRFRRSCLRKKQLLYKENGLEIGVVSDPAQTNQHILTLFLTNYSDRDMWHLRIKIMNPNGNRIKETCPSNSILRANQQMKIDMSCEISHYPIGPVVYSCSYQLSTQSDSSEVRVLLPIHIWKTCQVETRDSYDMTQPTIMAFPTEEKIVKNMESLSQYFKIQSKNQSMNLAVFHKHTHTLWFLTVELIGPKMHLKYQHVEGNLHITQYAMTTLKFLLSK